MEREFEPQYEITVSNSLVEPGASLVYCYVTYLDRLLPRHPQQFNERTLCTGLLGSSDVVMVA